MFLRAPIRIPILQTLRRKKEKTDQKKVNHTKRMTNETNDTRYSDETNDEIERGVAFSRPRQGLYHHICLGELAWLSE
jgi:hypothetical protein